MNHSGLPHMPPGVPSHQPRRQPDYHYSPSPHYAYPTYHHQPQYYAPPPQHHYPQQWYQPHQHYQPPPMPRPYIPQQSQQPLVVSSYPLAPPTVPPMNRQPTYPPPPSRTPQPEQSIPSVTSQPVISNSTTPTETCATTSTPPASKDLASMAAPQMATPAPVAPSIPPQPPQHMPFYPKLPWYSVPKDTWPSRSLRPRRKRKVADAPSATLDMPSRGDVQELEIASAETVPEPAAGEEADAQPQSTESIEEEVLHSEAPSSPPVALPAASSVATDVSPSESKPAQAVTSHKRNPTKPVVPIIPIKPIGPNNTTTSPRSGVSENQSQDAKTSPKSEIAIPSAPQAQAIAAENMSENSSDVSAPAEKAAPKSWAELLRSKAAATASGAGAPPAVGSVVTTGVVVPKANSLADAVRLYDVKNESKIAFLKPRGLVNTGNMCYMNSILQTLVFCVPFYEFLDQVSKRVAHSFKSESPLVEAMILFMREFPIIDSATSVDQLRMRLKDTELEQYGESFIPEYVYDVIKGLPRFSSMRRGHQQDAEEFLGFLLEGLHDECVNVMKKMSSESALRSSDGIASPTNETSSAVNSGDNGWLEVGPKQKAAVTRSSGAIETESPVTKIFGGKLRSVFRVPGLKDSVTLEPYQPLQLDIGGPNVFNITDALKNLTKSETIYGDFNSPRGPGTSATKQVFIETLPPVLILHLKRFQYDNTGGTQKIWKKIGYPLELEIPKDVFPPHKRGIYSVRPEGLPKYRLIGVVYHHGKNASGGHYTVDVRRQEGREWIRLDDTVIRRVRSDDVAGEGGEEDPKVLAAALESHKHDDGAAKNVFKATGFSELGDDEDEEDQGGWSQVNGSPTVGAGGQKKWSGVVNGASTPSTAGKMTPKETKYSIKDNKVAYILFYQQVTA